MFPFYLVFIIGFLYYLIDSKKNSIFLLALFFAYLAIFIGLGDMIGGYDRYIYGEVFDSIANEMNGNQNFESLYYLINDKEFGYFYWQVLVSYITANRYIFILITTLACYTLYFLSFRKYMEHYPFAAIIFLGLFYYFTMTYLRQVIAVGIIWNSIQFIWRRKPIPFFALVLLAYLFHGSALIIAPMYFIPIKKYNQTTIVVFLIICLILAFSPLPNLLITSSGDATGMEKRTQEYTNEEQGFRIEYVLEVIFFITIFFLNYKKIKETPKDLTFLNMSIVFCAILFFFMRFGQGGRLGWYYMFGLIYTLSNLCYGKNVIPLLKPIVIVVFFLLFTRITIAWAPMQAPYKTFLTNGRPNGYIYDNHEYDDRYTVDKFYR